MTHLTTDQLYTLVFDKVELDPISAAHLLHCANCRAERQNLAQMANDLAVMQASQPSAASLARYHGYFDQVTHRGSPVSALWHTIVATLSWDSRQQPSLQGVRTAGGAVGYRLLYVSDGAEIELMIEPDQNRFRLHGEYLADDITGSYGISLIQLLDAGGAPVCDHETDADGCFRCTDIEPGVYRLVVSPPTGASIEVEALEIG